MFIITCNIKLKGHHTYFQLLVVERNLSIIKKKKDFYKIFLTTFGGKKVTIGKKYTK